MEILKKDDYDLKIFTFSRLNSNMTRFLINYGIDPTLNDFIDTILENNFEVANIIFNQINYNITNNMHIIIYKVINSTEHYLKKINAIKYLAVNHYVLYNEILFAIMKIGNIEYIEDLLDNIYLNFNPNTEQVLSICILEVKSLTMLKNMIKRGLDIQKFYHLALEMAWKSNTPDIIDYIAQQYPIA